MPSGSLTTTLVIGATAGLGLFALSYGVRVWAHRQGSAGGGPRPLPDRIAALGQWMLAAWAIVLLSSGVSQLEPIAADGFLEGEDLYSVAPRPDFDPLHVTQARDVEKGDVLVRFGVARRLDPASQGALRDEQPLSARLEDRERHAQEVFDLVRREMTKLDFEYESRRHKLEHDVSLAQAELGEAKEARTLARRDVESGEALLAKGLIARRDQEDSRFKLLAAERIVRNIEERLALLETERTEIARSHDRAKSELDRQLAAARKDLAELEARLAVVREALADPERGPVARAPFGGRVGFRNPSPHGADAGPLLVLYDPERVWVSARVETDLARGVQDGSEIEALFAQARSVEEFFAGRYFGEELRPGRLALKAPAWRGFEALRIACDPPPAAMRDLVEGRPVPVRLRIQPPLLSIAAFRWAALAAALALLVAVVRARLAREAATPDAPRPLAAPAARRPTATPIPLPRADRAAPLAPAFESEPALARLDRAGIEVVEAAPAALLEQEAERRPAAAAASLRLVEHPGARREAPAATSVATGTTGGAGAMGGAGTRAEAPPPAIAVGGAVLALPLPAPAGERAGTPPSGDDFRTLRARAASLRAGIEGGRIDRAVLRAVDRTVRAGQGASLAALIFGFGEGLDAALVAGAACGLLARDGDADALGLEERIEDCAALLRVLRALAAHDIASTLGPLKRSLADAAAIEAERAGLAAGKARALVGPLRWA
jgi:multidrug resistance efflux pump